MFTIFLTIYFLLFSFLAWRRLLWGLILIAAFLPAYLIRFQVFGVPGTVLEGMIIITLLIWLIKNRKNLKSFPIRVGTIFNFHWKSPWLWAIILFLAAATISALISPHPLAAWGIWKAYFIEPILFFVVLISTVKNRENLNKIIWGLVLGALPVALFAVIQKFTGWLIPNPFWQAAETRRVTSFFGYPNAVALYLAPLIPLIIYLLKEQRTKNKLIFQILLFLILCSSFLAIIFAASTGALVALAATAAIFGLWHKRTRWFMVGLIVAAAILIPLSPLHEPFRQEMLFGGRSGVVRLNMWAETWKMLKERPLLGAGLAGYQTAVQPFHILNWAEIYLYPHNLFLNFWSETGLLGLIGFWWLIILFFAGATRRVAPAPLVKCLAASMLIILIHGLVDVPYFKNDLAVMFWILVGMFGIIVKAKKA